MKKFPKAIRVQDVSIDKKFRRVSTGSEAQVTHVSEAGIVSGRLLKSGEMVSFEIGMGEFLSQHQPHDRRIALTQRRDCRRRERKEEPDKQDRRINK